MKVRVEHGHIYSTKANTRTPYITTYTQPLRNVVVAWLYYYVWEKLTGRLYRFLEKRVYISNDWLWIPYTNRQDIRCYHLRQKNRKVIETIKGSPHDAT